jgi:uncharacterized DUF497 family protein
MKLYEVVWKEQFVIKLYTKHGVEIEEVEGVLFTKPIIRLSQKGKIKGEDLYIAYGQTDEDRYLTIFFVYKGKGMALPISARDMTQAERRYYERQK